MANVTFDPANKGSALALSNLNLTATSSASIEGVLATSGQAAGKYYFEYVLGAGTVGASSHYLGLAKSFVAPNASGSTDSIKFIPQSTTAANLNLNGTSVASFSGLPAMGSGTVIGCALDLDNQRAWFRVGATGNWNGSGTATPATPSTGVSLSPMGMTGFSLLPHIVLFTSGTSLTANFGDSAFTGAVPTGFTSGFPAGGSSNALFTQEGAEVWGNFPSTARFTQMGVEVWRSAADAPVVNTPASMAMMLS